MWRWVLPVAVAVAVLIGFLASRNGPTTHVPLHAAPTTSTPVTTPGPHLRSICGSLTGTATVRHVIWIWMGGQSYAHMIGKVRVAPYINQLAGQCGIATNYTTITHPAIANDVGALAGDPHGLVHNACAPCTTTAASLLSQVPSWRAFIGGMPTPCSKLAASKSGYSRLSNPPTYLTVRGCPRFDLPLGTATGGGLAQLLAKNSLPAFTMIVPDACHDTGFDKHCGGAVKRGVFIARGDLWLRKWMHTLTSSLAYRSGSTVIFITWNQGTPATPLHVACPTASIRTPGACQVPLLVVSPYVRGSTTVTARLSHYSLLRATEKLLGARTQLGNAGVASAGDLVRAFGL
jgi:phosphatidylinositol-3-phosphatase